MLYCVVESGSRDECHRYGWSLSHIHKIESKGQMSKEQKTELKNKK